MVTLPETNSLPLKINGWKMKFPSAEAYFQALCQFQGGLIYLVPNGGLVCAKHDQGAIMQRMMGVAVCMENVCLWYAPEDRCGDHMSESLRMTAGPMLRFFAHLRWNL